MPAQSHANFIKPTASGVGFYYAAVQSVSVTTNTPKNPLQSLGYKGTVGYIKQPNTADVTIEEFIPANITKFTNATSSFNSATMDRLSDIATTADAATGGSLPTLAGATECVLSGATFNFTAGQPARATWTYLGRGGDASIDTTTAITGDGTQKTVLLWEDVNVVHNSFAGLVTNSVPLSGVQSVTFTGQINKDTLFALGLSGVYQHVTTFPINVQMTIESYQDLLNVDADAISGNVAVGCARVTAVRQVSRGQSVAVGGYLTNTEQYIAADLEWYKQNA